MGKLDFIYPPVNSHASAARPQYYSAFDSDYIATLITSLTLNFAIYREEMKKVEAESTAAKR